MERMLASAISWLLAAALLFAGCGDGDETSSPTEPPPTDRTGIEGVDAVIDAVLSGDPERVRELVGYTAVPCEIEPVGIGAPPKCRADEADGTLIDVLMAAQCEGFYIRADEMEQALNSLVEPESSLYAVYRAPPSHWPSGDYVAILSVNHPQAGVIGRRLVIEGERLVGVDFGCAQTPEQMVQFLDLDDVVLPPRTSVPSPIP